MYRTPKSLFVLRRIFENGVLLSPRKVNNLDIFRNYTGARKNPEASVVQENEVLSYRDILKQRHQQAKQSILVQIESQRSCADLCQQLQRYGNIEVMIHFVTKQGLHLALVEMDSEKSVQEVMSRTKMGDNQCDVPIETQFMWFKTTKSKASIMPTRFRGKIQIDMPIYSSPERYFIKITENEMGVVQQANLLYSIMKINDLGMRLRFLTARQIEQALSGVFPRMLICPFGSCMSGFGTNDSDLDMVALTQNCNETEDLRLRFHVKGEWDFNKTEKNYIAVVHRIMESLLPGCEDVIPIPHARVPILKFHHKFTSLDCDLSFFRAASVVMTELLYLVASLDPRVKPLVFTIRQWAKSVRLTNIHPGKWITNFSISLLVLFFLQQKIGGRPPVLPPFQLFLLQRSNMLTSKQFSSFINQFQAQANQNDLSIAELLISFFEFYSDFRFQNKGINLRTGEICEKPGGLSSLYIENPLDTSLNISKNVHEAEVKKLQFYMKIARGTLEYILSQNGHSEFNETLGDSNAKSNLAALFQHDNYLRYEQIYTTRADLKLNFNTFFQK